MDEQALKVLGSMGRKDREIQDEQEIFDILKTGTVMHLAMVDNGHPFLLPLNYVLDGKSLYFHSARKGRKMGILSRNPEVCFSVSLDYGVIESTSACDFEVRHRTVIGMGHAFPVESFDEKSKILERLVARFSDQAFTFPPDMLEKTAVTEIRIEALTGKKHGC